MNMTYQFIQFLCPSGQINVCVHTYTYVNIYKYIHMFKCMCVHILILLL